MRIIKYTPAMAKQIVNISQLSAGRGCKYLLCFVSDDKRVETFVAMKWKRKKPIELPPHQLLIEFPKEEPTS